MSVRRRRVARALKVSIVGPLVITAVVSNLVGMQIN